jgi:hypothetical protein
MGLWMQLGVLRAYGALRGSGQSGNSFTVASMGVYGKIFQLTYLHSERATIASGTLKQPQLYYYRTNNANTTLNYLNYLEFSSSDIVISS